MYGAFKKSTSLDKYSFESFQCEYLKVPCLYIPVVIYFAFLKSNMATLFTFQVWGLSVRKK